VLLSATVLFVAGCGTNSHNTAPEVDDTVPTPASQTNQPGLPDKRLVRMDKDAEHAAQLGYGEARDRLLDMNVVVTGEVLANANTQTHVTTPVTGRVTKILVSIGDHIPEGKPLLIVRSTDIQQAESDLLQGEQQVRSDLKQALVQIDCDTATAKAQVKLSETIYQRLKNLVE